MTCEVAVANKLAIALAADSAVTFSGSGAQTTYASGANKIFQLAMEEPVAVMIYNNAVLAGVPWELILKCYRENLGRGGFKQLEGYGSDLVRYLNECADELIPLSARIDSTIRVYLASARYTIRKIIGFEPQLLDTNVGKNDIATLWQNGFEKYSNFANSASYCFGVEENDYINSLSHAPNLENLIKDLFSGDVLQKILPFVDITRFAQLSILTAFKFGHEAMSGEYTGVVIAGFGQNDYLPGYKALKFFGFLAGKIFYSVASELAVDHNGKSSIIEAFAQRAMVETFTQGASPEVWSAVRDAFERAAETVAKEAVKKSGGHLSDTSVREIVHSHRSDFMKNWSYSVFDGHLKPLYHVVTSLSVEELAELAETLVLLESLKEKVTHRTQSVGGPIDVAIITKTEGLVWIKRKLYFEPHLNHRYFNRLNRPKE